MLVAMMEEPPAKTPWTKRLLWLAWVVYVLAWSRGLLMEQPIDPGDNERLRLGLFLFAKAVHVGSYAVFAVLSALLDAPRPYRWLLLAFMSAHAMATEYGQHFFATRHPSWGDVGLDHLGILVGVALTWRWWRKNP